MKKIIVVLIDFPFRMLFGASKETFEHERNVFVEESDRSQESLGANFFKDCARLFYILFCADIGFQCTPACGNTTIYYCTDKDEAGDYKQFCEVFLFEKKRKRSCKSCGCEMASCCYCIYKKIK